MANAEAWAVHLQLPDTQGLLVRALLKNANHRDQAIATDGGGGGSGGGGERKAVVDAAAYEVNV
jgi:hypothetical protein